MLRPATPLAILLFVAFVLLLLSVLSTPIIKAIPLGVYKPENGGSVNFGVFGYCEGNVCGPIEIGYDTSIFAPQASSEFDLPSSTRTRLSAILIVHPVAAFLTLIMFVMASVAHLHSPSHSSRYLCGLFIFGFLTFLVCLLAFLIDVLLFVPHLAWGSWLVLAATILVFLSFIVSCAMRRTLVGRKARKRRIAENAEMSGENYYNRQAQQEAAVTSAVTSGLQPTVPSVSDANGPADKLPAFAAYEKRDDHSSDERIPLTARTPSERSPNNGPVDRTRSDLSNNRQSFSGSTLVPTDQYGNPLTQVPDPYGMRRGPSIERMDGRGRGGPMLGYRGRGGLGRGTYGGGSYGPPQNGRGGYGSPSNGRGGYAGSPNGRGGYGGPSNGRGSFGGPPNGRGGYGAPSRGGYAPGPNGRGGYGPRGGYGGGMRGGRTPPPGYSGGAPYDRRGTPGEAYGPYGSERRASPAAAGAPYEGNPSMYNGSTSVTNTGAYQPYRPDDVNDLPRAESPPPLPDSDLPEAEPVGQAVEMDARTGSPAHPPSGLGQLDGPIRDSGTDVEDMLAFQQTSTLPPQQNGMNHEKHDSTISETANYSHDEQYVPPRQAWDQQRNSASQGIPPSLQISVPAKELNTVSPTPPPLTLNEGGYYEDVDPRFAEPPPVIHQVAQHAPTSTDDLHLSPGTRSPAISERSGFTSVSQRSVNPRWNPSTQGYNQPLPTRRPANRGEINILNSDPDFELSGLRTTSASPARGSGMVPGSAYPGAL
ncbi:pali-domain-containing protein [Xylaria nigripes]|nr:pali-domain-containing protein [Xylaria nigripes]